MIAADFTEVSLPHIVGYAFQGTHGSWGSRELVQSKGEPDGTQCPWSLSDFIAMEEPLKLSLFYSSGSLLFRPYKSSVRSSLRIRMRKLRIVQNILFTSKCSYGFLEVIEDIHSSFAKLEKNGGKLFLILDAILSHCLCADVYRL